MSRRFFARRFAQTLSADRAEAAYERYIVPTPGRVYWDGVVGPMKIDWSNPQRPPLLLIGGGRDLIADAGMTRAIHRKQRRAPTRTDYIEFPDRSHWTLLDEGWERVADAALDWAERASA
jgi:pimeloyl-ACP methyl ester carboxylesterase